MQTLRHNRGWLALALVLVMVFTMGGLPAAAVACGSLGEPSSLLTLAAERVRNGACDQREIAGDCCCDPKADLASGREPRSGWTRSDCGCVLQAPPAAPAADRTASRLLLLIDGAYRSPAAVSFTLPTIALRVHPAPVIAAPRTASRGGTPPRAPPAC